MGFLRRYLQLQIQLMVQKSGGHQLIWTIYHYLHGFGYISGGYIAGFLNTSMKVGHLLFWSPSPSSQVALGRKYQEAQEGPKAKTRERLFQPGDSIRDLFDSRFFGGQFTFKAYLKMIFPFPRWDMLISWRVTIPKKGHQQNHLEVVCFFLFPLGCFLTPRSWQTSHF